MIQVYSQERVRLCLLHHYRNLAITKTLSNGDKELSFEYPQNGPGFADLQAENYIMTRDDEFVLKEIGGGGKEWIKYRAILNLEELQGKSYESFETVEKTVAECLGVALLGTGWRVGISTVKKRRTIRKDSVCNVIDIIEQCVSTYKVEVTYHTKTKVIDIVEQVGSDKGAYFMEAVNLRKPPNYTFSSNEFYTQIRPIGKDGLKINVGGKDYIENHSYSPKNLMFTWKDERYTSTSSLAEDAALKLAEMCAPIVTYEADVIDLAKASKEYDVLAYALGDTVALVSKSSAVKARMRIVKITEYPETPERNTCQLSSAKKTFAEMQEEVIAEAVREATGTAAANTSEQVGNESDITSEEIRLSMEGMKTEILKDVSDGYVAKDDAGDIAKAAADAAAADAKKYVDQQMGNFATEKMLNDEITAAKKEVRQEMSALELNVEQTLTTQQESIQTALTDQQKAVEQALQDAETAKNDVTAPDGSVWRMGIDDTGRLYFERLEDSENA